MANRKMNKLDKYVETRIWNLKLKNRNISTEDLIKEMVLRFNLVDKTSLSLKLQKTILTARRRVMRRRTAMKNNITIWASKLFLPEKIVAQWAWNDLLTEKNFEHVFEILSAYKIFLASKDITQPV